MGYKVIMESFIDYVGRSVINSSEDFVLECFDAFDDPQSSILYAYIGFRSVL